MLALRKNFIPPDTLSDRLTFQNSRHRSISPWLMALDRIRYRACSWLVVPRCPKRAGIAEQTGEPLLSFSFFHLRATGLPAPLFACFAVLDTNSEEPAASQSLGRVNKDYSKRSCLRLHRWLQQQPGKVWADTYDATRMPWSIVTSQCSQQRKHQQHLLARYLPLLSNRRFK